MGRRNKQKKCNEKIDHSKNGSYDAVVKENKQFEAYYKQLGIVPENEWNEFMTCLRGTLPVTFRITSYKSYANEVLSILKEKHFKYLKDLKSDTQDLAYNVLPWYPNELGWQVNLSRQDVKKNEIFKVFKQFLVEQTACGHISRQEAVSMIPPLVLDIQPHHRVLDMCAAPGSKTAQLIEYLHANTSNPVPDGFVVANDVDNKRCYMLCHQLKRLESPNFMIINHDSSVLPNFRNQDGAPVAYDRILADVPCSGDGTLKKNLDIWMKWNIAHAINLHSIQSRIARRAAELLKPGGIMVYSTCSFNPVENEAVVANLLQEFNDELELVDARDKLKGLRTIDGLKKWILMNREGKFYENYEQVEEKYQCLLRPQMFAPNEEKANELHLERCIRVLPHHQNTGGFFIAVIQKKAIINQQQESQVVLDENLAVETKSVQAPPFKRFKGVFEENPFTFLSDDKTLESWPLIKQFFDLSDDFPMNQLMTRNKKDERSRNVYFVSKSVADLVKVNGDRIKFINMGVRFFRRAEIKENSNVDLKVCQESIDIAQKYFGKRVLKIDNNQHDIFKLLMESLCDVDTFSDEFKTQLLQVQGSGNIVLNVCIRDEKIINESKELQISFTGWLGKNSLRPFINVQTRQFYLQICGVSQEVIDEAMERIKAEDQAATDKSKLNNPDCKEYNKSTQNEDNSLFGE